MYEGDPMKTPSKANVRPLVEAEVPLLLQEQIDAFTPEAMRVENIGQLEISLPEGKSVIAVDIGGDSLTASQVTVNDGKLEHHILVDLSDVKEGVGYIEALEGLREYSVETGLAIGMSYAGPKEGTKPTDGVNVPIFMAELAEKYEGDLSKVLPTLIALDNDAVAGLRRGALESQRITTKGNSVIYVINGSGLNTAFLINGKGFASESGHVKVDPRLNPYGQQKPCGLFGAEYVCVESIAGNKAGVEDIWRQQTGQSLNGREIEALYLSGNTLAGKLYDDSALVTAHVIAGAAKGMGLDLAYGTTTIVGHGGTFKFPGYGARIEQILKLNLGSESKLLQTKDFSPNACLEGAAISALAKV